MAAKTKTRAKRPVSTLKSVERKVRKTMNHTAARVERKAKSLQHDAVEAADQVGDWASDGANYVSKTVKNRPFLSGAVSAAAVATLGLLFFRR